MGQLILEHGGIVVQLTDLEADLCEFVRIEGGDARFGGAELTVGKAGLLVGIKQNVVGHDDLRTVGDEHTGRGYAALLQGVHLPDKILHTEGYAVADDVGHVAVEHARRAAGGAQTSRNC